MDADDLRAEADRWDTLGTMSAQGHRLDHAQEHWARADRLRAQADALDAQRIDWRAEVRQRVLDAVREVGL